MAGIKLGKLPDRAPVKLTITVTPDLKRALDDYAQAYARTYSVDESVSELIPAMLRAFMDSDRGFARRTAT